MADKIKVAVMGASGRMGQELIRAVIANELLTLVGGTERAGHDWIGRDVGACLGGADIGAKVVADAVELFAKADAVIDFTSPESSVFHAELAAQARCVLVIGTTGFNAEQLEKIAAAGRHARIVRSGNMSLGINLLAKAANLVSSVLGGTYDIDIVETHHRNKVDKPSGTALMLGEAVDRGKNKITPDALISTPDIGIVGARKNDGAIQFSSIRAGDVVGEHDVIFSGAGERLILRHIATNRNIFVQGALYAASWGIKQPAGEYDMQDVLASLWEEFKN